jgi:hypothetical protein
MLATEFLKTIYLGDRACKSITIDGWWKRVVIQVDEISRIRSASGQWDYYNEENIIDGSLVFVEARSIQFHPVGPIPNDHINYLEAELIEGDYYRFRLSVGSVDSSSQSTEVVVIIEAKSMHLENPGTPGVSIED